MILNRLFRDAKNRSNDAIAFTQGAPLQHFGLPRREHRLLNIFFNIFRLHKSDSELMVKHYVNMPASEAVKNNVKVRVSYIAEFCKLL